MKNDLIIPLFFVNLALFYQDRNSKHMYSSPLCVYVFACMCACVHVCLLGGWYPVAFIHKLLMLFFSFKHFFFVFTNTEVHQANEWSLNFTNILTFLGRNDSSEAYYLVCMMWGMCCLEADGGWLQMSHLASLVLHKQSALLTQWHTAGRNKDVPYWFSEGKKI